MRISGASFIIAISLMASIASGRKTENGPQLLLMSSSLVKGHEFLHHSKKDILDFCERNEISRILFVPYAQTHHNKYTEKVAKALKTFSPDLEVTGLHRYRDKKRAINGAECVILGGGNTFLLLKTLYDLNLVNFIRKRVLSGDLPYMGWSAGTNVATKSIQTTNDMPIIYPPTLTALRLVPFNINPHYLDADPNDSFHGETRETRLNEFHEIFDTPVLGLREGTALRVDGERAELLGEFNGRLFRKGAKPTEIEPNTDLTFLLDWEDEER